MEEWVKEGCISEIKCGYIKKELYEMSPLSSKERNYHGNKQAKI